MSYLGNSPPSQNFVAGADQFSGTGSQTVFTLSRNVNTVFDIFVTVSNVPQDPFTAYTVAGNTLTFDGAPPAGTNNIDVVYRATNVQTFVPSPGVSTQLGLGSAAAPSLTFIGDTNTGIYSPAADTIAFAEGGAEVARFDSSGNFGIGTSSPAAKLDVNGVEIALKVVANNGGIKLVSSENSTNTGYAAFFNGTSRVGYIGYADTTNGLNLATDAGSSMPLRFVVNGTEEARITTAGLFQFDSGYGSVATAYGCRAWVNFNGTANTNLSGTYSQSGTTVTVTATAHGLIAGNSINADITTGTGVDGIYTVASVISSSQFTYTAGTSLTTSGNITLLRNTIRASGGVSSVSDNGTGDYTVNFTTAMPDADYAVVCLNHQSTGNAPVTTNINTSRTSSASLVQISTTQGATRLDTTLAHFAIFR